MRAGVVAWLAALLVPAGLARPSYAADPARALSQFLVERWGSDRGFPGGPVHAIAQTADGYLWIAAEKGLVRFDGLTFRLFQHTGSTADAGPTVLDLTPTPDGGLWARLRGPGLVRLRNGTLEDTLHDLGLTDSVITALFHGRDGRLFLASLADGTVAYQDGRVTRIASHEALPTASIVIAMVETPDRDLWLGTRSGGLLRVHGARMTRIADGLPDPKINCLLSGADGDLWIGTDKGAARWTGQQVTRAGVPEPLTRLPVRAMARDADGNVWVAAGPHGLLRVTADGRATTDAGDARTRGDVTSVFEDRERNLWIGTTRGLERWRDPVFASYSRAEGLPSDHVGPVHVDAGGRTWFAPIDGGLYWLQDGTVRRVAIGAPEDDVVYSIGGRGDQVWIGRQRGGLTRLRPRAAGFVAERYMHADGLAQDSVYAVHQADDGAVWAGTLSAGASRLKAGAFTTYDASSGLPSNTVASILESADGTVWFATPGGVAARSRGGWRHYTTSDGLPSNDTSVLFEDATGVVWAGTSAGLAILHPGGVRAAAAPTVMRAPIVGLAEDAGGWLWVATVERVLRLRREPLVQGTLGDADVRAYTAEDGLLAVEGVKRHRTLVSDAGGRIWIALGRGLSVGDPARLERRAVTALVHVEQVAADGTPVDASGPVTIPSGRRRLAIGYAGLSLTIPERVTFRYRLDGFDRDWSEPVSERQAVYTNLGPGLYVFRVTASTGEGGWSPEASLRLEIEPALRETPWFRAAIALAAVLGVWGLYRLRLLQVARQLHSRFDERLDERTRIAQELHDTLLQGFVSASMQLHVAADRLPADSPVKASLGSVLDLMGRVIDEGRNAVRGLRGSTSAPHALEQAFAGIPRELAIQPTTEYRVVVEGKPRPLNPVIRDEVYRIGREGLVNAFRHSGAARIEVELEYGPRALRLLVRDDGRGIDPEVVRSGSDGHWGLAGMRERAERVGARLKVTSGAALGTELELTVPGQVAFPPDTTARSRRWGLRAWRLPPRTDDRQDEEHP